MATAERSHPRDDCGKEEDSDLQNHRQDAQGREIASVVGITNHALHPNLQRGFMTCATVTGETNMSCGSSKLPVLFIEEIHLTEERCVFDMSTEKFHIIKNRNFQGAKCICGRGQWLLMCQEVDLGDCWFSLFLLNPVTGVKVDLPTVHGFPCGPCTFSLSSGYPDLIVSGNTHVRRGVFTLRIIRPSDEAWEEHSIGGIQDTNIHRVVLAGMRVLCVDYKGRVIVFDPIERNLRYLTNLKPCLNGLRAIIECDGEIVKIDCNRPMFRYFRFTRFDWGLMNWVEVDERELRNASWFMDCPSACMRTCEGMKVYTMIPNEYGGPNQPDYYARSWRITSKKPSLTERMFNIYMHDLVCCPEDPLLATAFMEKKTTKSLMPEDVRARHVRWVSADILC